MQATEALREFFSREQDVAAVYLYGTYAGDRSFPDTDIEIALLFPEATGEEAAGEYLEGLADRQPLGEHPGILMPAALNHHILPVIYEILRGGTLLVDNDPATRAAFARRTEVRLEEERAGLMDAAGEAIVQARSLGPSIAAGNGLVLPQPPRYLDPIRIGWRLSRILGSVVVLDQVTRDDDHSGDPERMGQVAGWFSNGVGAATGIGKAMLNMFEMARPARRWEIFLPLADAGLVTMELALHLAAAIELRWSLLTGGMVSWERVTGGIRSALVPVTAFARLAAWYCDLPGGRTGQKVH